jgi:hypothetical protein
MNHIDAIRAQIRVLEDEVRKDPRVSAIQHLKAALAALEGVPSVALNSVEQLAEATLTAQRATPRPGSIRKDSKIKRIGDLVGNYVDEHGPTHRSVLVKMLGEAGLNEGVKNPLTAFATSMHTLKEDFVSDGQGTFRRRESEPSDILGHHFESPRGDTGGVAPPAVSFSEQHDRKRVVESDTEAGGT